MTIPPDQVRILSVGYSNHEPERFLALLQGAGVTAVADVRTSPYSRRMPHFNGPQLVPLLRRIHIAYVFLGDALGGRPADDYLYDAEDRVDYERVRATEVFQRGLDRLIEGGRKYVVAMMCGEADPLDCHRGLMITPALIDGRVESTEEMEQRLLAETGVGAGEADGLFAAQLSDEARREILTVAYREMARKKAFRRGM
jgi:hypothetical protein